jgi:hypothetical protein
MTPQRIVDFDNEKSASHDDEECLVEVASMGEVGVCNCDALCLKL